MTKMETKEKGDIGVVMAISDLTRRGYKIALPISEHLPFDLIVISPTYQLAKISVKYCGDESSLKIALRTISSNSKGYKIKRVNIDDIDGFAVYSPITNKCYYVNKEKMIGRSNQIGLKLSNVTTCSNKKQMLFANDFENPEYLFKHIQKT